MKNKGPLILVGMVAALGGFLAWDYAHEEAVAKKKDANARLVTLAKDQINEVEIRSPQNHILLVRTVDGWKLDSPVKDWADSAFVDDFVERMATDKSLEVAKEGDGIDWKVYGLDAPMGHITFKSQSGESQSIEVSSKQNFEQNSIARRAGENKVLIVPASWSNNIARLPIDFREKRFFRPKLSGIDHLDLKNANGQIQLVLKDGKWSLPSRPEWSLDQNRVREILTMLTETKAKDYLAEGVPSEEQKKKWGLDHPLVTIKVLRAGKEWFGDLGRDTDGNEAGAVSDPLLMMQFEKGTLKKFAELSEESLRDHRAPFQFDRSFVQRIELETPVKKTAFVKKNNLWELAEPAPGFTVDEPKVSAIVATVSEMHALHYVSPVAAKKFKAEQKIRIMGEGQKLLFELAWGPAFKFKDGDQETSVVLAKTNLSDEVMQLEEVALTQMQLNQLTKSVAPEKPKATEKEIQLMKTDQSEAPPGGQQ